MQEQIVHSPKELFVLPFADMITIGKKIGEALEIRAMNQSELARKIGVDPKNINNYVNDTRKPKPEILKKIAQGLELPVGWFYGEQYSGLSESPAPAFEHQPTAGGWSATRDALVSKATLFAWQITQDLKPSEISEIARKAADAAMKVDPKNPRMSKDLVKYVMGEGD